MKVVTAALGVLLCTTLAGTLRQVLSQTPDSTWFPYSPAHQLTAICLPDDWQKTLVTETGALGYDFGPGPYAFPRTEVQVGMLEIERPAIRQWLPDAAMPLVATRYSGIGATALVHAFALVSGTSTGSDITGSSQRVTRLNGLNGAQGWANPPAGTDPTFANVAWGTNRALRYMVRVEPGGKRRIALGFCESYKSRSGSRYMNVEVEGDSVREVDPMPDGVQNQPTAILTDGCDLNRDGRIAVTLHPSLRTPDPNIILNALWVFPAETRVSADEVVSGAAAPRAELRWSCGTELAAFAPTVRTDALLATFEGEHCTPVIRIKTRRPLVFDPVTRTVRLRGEPFLASRPVPASGRWHGDTLVLVLPSGTRRADIVVIHGNGIGANFERVPDLREEEQRCKTYWTQESPVPHPRIRIPDARMQYLLDASVRNIYQIREIVDGGLQYQPGPTVYRGLWLFDVFISGNVSMMFGDTLSVRTALEAGFRNQSTNGQFRSLFPATSMAETPGFLAMMFRYARTAQNEAWLERNWQIVQRGIAWIEAQRLKTLDEPGAAYAGLLPPGFVDGGISHRTADYGSVWWAMIALEQAIEAARGLGRDVEADCWSRLLADFSRSFYAAAARDIRPDSAGNRYLPITVADTTMNIPPQRGQFLFLLSLPYGRFFFDPGTTQPAILQGNMAMLDARCAEGLITGSGWMNDGVWPWLGSVHSMAQLLAGDRTRAWTILNSVADHAGPAGTWIEEQQLRAIGRRTSGDGSNAEASAFFVQALTSLLVLERPDSLVFCPGLPGEWLRPGSSTSVDELLTTRGPVSLAIETSSDGTEVTLRIRAMRTHAPAGGMSVDLTPFHRSGFRDTQGRILPPAVNLPWGSTYQVTLKRW